MKRPIYPVVLRVYAFVIHFTPLDRHWLYHHFPVHPVRPYTYVLHHGSSVEHSQVQPAEIQVWCHLIYFILFYLAIYYTFKTSESIC